MAKDGMGNPPQRRTTTTSTDVRVYRPHSRYTLMAGASSLLFLLLSWSFLAPLFRGEPAPSLASDAGLYLFLAISVGIGLWSLRLALSRIEVAATSLTLRMPLARPRCIALRQVADVSESSRGRAVIVLYHPMAENGLIDADEIASLTLPEVDDQTALLAELEARIAP